MVLSWSERDAGDLEATFIESGTDSSEELTPSPPAPPQSPFSFPHGESFKLFGKPTAHDHVEPPSYHSPSPVVSVDESSEEVKFRNGVTGKYVSDGDGASRYITGSSTYFPHQDDSQEQEVAVRPLDDQVGGHTRLLVLNPATICKPLNLREFDFYEHLPHDLAEFVPDYKGVMQAMNCKFGKYSPHFHEERREKAGGKRKQQEPLGLGQETIKLRVCQPNECTPAHPLNQSQGQYLLLLENITSKYKNPCILDLKMGTRQHGDDATAEKRTLHMAKCAASTSSRLGARLCGMQVYQANTENYMKRDKYWGRELDEQGFKSALFRFFHNGYQLRRHVIHQVMARLENLRAVISKQATYRFYSCSLLVVYEGYDCCPTGKDPYNADHRVIEGCSKDEPSVVDTGDRTDPLSDFSPVSEETMFLDASNELPKADYSGKDCRCLSKPVADTRIIDFAHTTFRKVTDGEATIKHEGPDAGFLLGLDSLMRLLNEILCEH